MSCEQRLEKLKSNPWVKKMKRDWWERVELRDPEWSKLFLKKSGWTKEPLESLLPRPAASGFVLNHARKRQAVTAERRKERYNL